MRPNLRPFLITILIVLLLHPGCSGTNSTSGKRSKLVLATTTSVQDSGILDEFVRRFEKDNPYALKPVSVGSGAALFMGRNGDADVMLTHEPKAEKEFMEAGYGESIHKVMHNDFVLVGPAKDPAGISGLRDADEAFRRIAASGSTFASRADGSGTNAMELSVWERIGIQPSKPWYLETGQGMGETLRISDEKGAYTISDRATFIVMEKGTSQRILVEGDARLLNQYSVTVVNPSRFPTVNREGAVAFSEFLRSAATKKLIKDFGWDRYNKRLFYPD